MGLHRRVDVSPQILKDLTTTRLARAAEADAHLRPRPLAAVNPALGLRHPRGFRLFQIRALEISPHRRPSIRTSMTTQLRESLRDADFQVTILKKHSQTQIRGWVLG